MFGHFGVIILHCKTCNRLSVGDRLELVDRLLSACVPEERVSGLPLNKRVTADDRPTDQLTEKDSPTDDEICGTREG